MLALKCIIPEDILWSVEEDGDVEGVLRRPHRPPEGEHGVVGPRDRVQQLHVLPPSRLRRAIRYDVHSKFLAGMPKVYLSCNIHPETQSMRQKYIFIIYSLKEKLAKGSSMTLEFV